MGNVLWRDKFWHMRATTVWFPHFMHISKSTSQRDDHVQIFCVYFNKFCRWFSDKFILAGAIMTYWRRLLFKKNTQQNNNQSHTKTQMDYKSCTHTRYFKQSKPTNLCHTNEFSRVRHQIQPILNVKHRKYTHWFYLIRRTIGIFCYSSNCFGGKCQDKIYWSDKHSKKIHGLHNFPIRFRLEFV